MAAITNISNSIRYSTDSACASILVLPLLDAAILLVVSVVVCLRVIMLGT